MVIRFPLGTDETQGCQRVILVTLDTRVDGAWSKPDATNRHDTASGGAKNGI
jgi:hypothetical protein